MSEPLKPAPPCDTPTHDCDQQQAEGSDLCVNCGHRCDAHREPIKPATDAQVEGLRKGLNRHAPVFDTAEDFSVWASIGVLIARIDSDAAKLKALELERDTVQEYADRTGANLRAAEGTLAERDEQIAKLIKTLNAVHETVRTSGRFTEDECPICVVVLSRSRKDAYRG